jgi:hypothetical protein
MNVDLNIAYTKTDHLCDALEQIGPVLFLGIEEAVLGSLSARVFGSVVGDAWPAVAPASDSAKSGLYGGSHAHRFVMIRDGNPDALRAQLEGAAPHAFLHVRKEPEFRMSRELHR